MPKPFRDMHSAQPRKLDYRFLVSFMTHLVDPETTATHAEAELFFKLMTAKDVLKDAVVRNSISLELDKLNAQHSDETSDYLRMVLNLLNRPRADFSGKPWRFSAISGNEQDKGYEVPGFNGRRPLSRILALELSGFLATFTELGAVSNELENQKTRQPQQRKILVLKSANEIIRIGGSDQSAPVSQEAVLNTETEMGIYGRRVERFSK